MTTSAIVSLEIGLALFAILALYVKISTKRYNPDKEKPRTWVADYVGNECYITATPSARNAYCTLEVKIPHAEIRDLFIVDPTGLEMKLAKNFVIKYVCESNWELTQAYQDLKKWADDNEKSSQYLKELEIERLRQKDDHGN